VALGPDSRLVLSVLVGKRLLGNAVLLLLGVRRRLAGPPELITGDEWAGYPDAIAQAFGTVVTPERTGRPGRPAGPKAVVPEGLNHAAVHKTREGGRVVKVEARIVRGTAESVEAALGGGEVSVSYLERQNGTDRHRNARKGRKTYRFSKLPDMHEALTYFTMYSYNFCWPVRTLRQEIGGRRYRRRTPAMAAGLTDRVWSLWEWITFPACQSE
jgi:hypothetical protein